MIPFAWFGGKSSHLRWLLPIIDSIPHRCYVESYGGSAAVLLNKRPSPIETYNDTYSDVVNFFRVLRDQPDELIRRIHLTPYSRQEFAVACADSPQNDLERARQFFVRARQVRSGLATAATPGRWAYVKEHSRRGVAQVVSSWLGSVDMLPDIALRLKEVQIENLDGMEVIRRYDGPETLHYVDPPYLLSTRAGGKAYAHELDDDAHRSLLALLRSVEGSVVLSGYDNELYNRRLHDWRVTTGPARMAPSTNRVKPSVRQEKVWIKA